MRVFIDTNILLDHLLNRQGYVEDAKNILLLGNAHLIDLCVSDLSIANIAYITRRDIAQSDFYYTMRTLSRCYETVAVGPSVVEKALNEEWSDFEDSLQYFSAIQANADCIVTRNPKDFESSTIPVYSPSEFLNTLERISY